MNSRIFYHARMPDKRVLTKKMDESVITNRLNKNPVFTVGLHYSPELNILFIGWSKPNKGEHYNRKFGIKIVNERLDKMIDNYPRCSYAAKAPKVVKDNINYYITKSLKYFKEIDKEHIIFLV